MRRPSSSLALEGEGWGEGGCFGDKQPSRSRAPPSRAANLHPLQGERQNRPSPAEFGEGSSAHPPQLVEAASSSLSLEGEGWGEGGCFGQAAKPKSSTIRQGRQSSPSPRGEADSAVLGGKVGEGSSAHPTDQRSRKPPLTSLSSTGEGWGEPSPAEFGQGVKPKSSTSLQLIEAAALPPSSLEGEGWARVAASTSKQPSRSRAPSRQGRRRFTPSSAGNLCRGLPRTRLTGEHQPPGPPIFTLSEGRGRFRRPRRKSVRGPSRTHPNWSKPPLRKDSHLRERAGVRVAATVQHPRRGRTATRPWSTNLNPYPRGEAESAVPGRIR